MPNKNQYRSGMLGAPAIQERDSFPTYDPKAKAKVYYEMTKGTFGPIRPKDINTGVTDPQGNSYTKSPKKVFKRGSRDTDTDHSINQLQEMLQNSGYYKGIPDGIYGKKTYDAVVAFQRDYNDKLAGKPYNSYDTKSAAGKHPRLVDDGIIGEETLAAMNRRAHVQYPKVMPMPKPKPAYKNKIGDSMVKYKATDKPKGPYADQGLDGMVAQNFVDIAPWLLTAASAGAASAPMAGLEAIALPAERLGLKQFGSKMIQVGAQGASKTYPGLIEAAAQANAKSAANKAAQQVVKGFVRQSPNAGKVASGVKGAAGAVRQAVSRSGAQGAGGAHLLKFMDGGMI